MRTPLRHQLLQQILTIIVLARPLVGAIARRDRDLASQARRALSSIALNAAEGFGTVAGNARLRFQTAHGSLGEAQVALQLAVACGAPNAVPTDLAITASGPLPDSEMPGRAGAVPARDSLPTALGQPDQIES